MTEIRASGHDRTTNALLMADCHTLGYLPEPVLDLTYGLGKFWTEYRPERLVTNDLHTDAATHRIDWTRPIAAEFVLMLTAIIDWGAVVFDPPYKLNGKPDPDVDRRYGVDQMVSAHDRWEAIKAGLDTAFSLAPRYVLVKLQDQVNAGRKTWQTYAAHGHVILEHGEDYRLVDQLHVRSYRAQPPGRRQLHARQDYSTLMVWGRQ